MQFTPQDYGTIANALRTAADTYKGHAVTCWELARDYHAKHLHSGPATGLAEQFERQAAEALEIAERIEDGEGV